MAIAVGSSFPPRVSPSLQLDYLLFLIVILKRTRVPFARTLSNSKQPPMFFIRLRMLNNPLPDDGCSFSENPWPLSSMETERTDSSKRRRNQSSVAPEYFTALFKASLITRKRLCRCSEDKGHSGN